MCPSIYPERAHLDPADPPRVLLLPELMTIGGGQLVYLRRALWLHSHGIPVALASAGGELSAQLDAAGVPFLELPLLGVQAAYSKSARLWQDSVRQLTGFADAHGVTVAQAMPIVPILAARELRRVRNVEIMCEFLGGQTHLVPPQTCVDGIVHGDFTCGGPGARQDLAERLGIDPELVRLMPIGIDADRFDHPPQHTVRDELGLAPSDTAIVNISRHDHDKIAHVLALVDAVQELSANRGDIHLVLAGDGSAHTAIERYARTALGDRAHLLGMTTDIVPLLFGADVVVAMGSVTYESALAGRATILCANRTMTVSDHHSYPLDEYAVGYMGEYDVDTTGDISDGMEPSSIAARLAPLLDDPAERERVAERGRQHVLARNELSAAMQPWLARAAELHERAREREQAGAPRAQHLYDDGRMPAHTPSLSAAPSLRAAILVQHQLDDVTSLWERWDALAARLPQWGIEATVVTRGEGLPGDVDVVFGAGLRNSALFEAWEPLRQHGVPVVLAGQFYDDRPLRTFTPAAVEVLAAADAQQLTRILRQTRAGGLPPANDPHAFALLERLCRHMARAAAEYRPNGDEERAQLAASWGVERPATGEFGPWADPLPAGDAARARARFGTEPYVLCLGGGIQLTENQAAICAAARERTVVLMGPPEAAYQYTCKRIAQGPVHLVGAADAQLKADAIAGAAVVVHAGFVCTDPALLAQAEARGVPMAVSTAITAPWPTDAGVERFDPWDVDDARAAIDRAIERGWRAPSGRSVPTLEDAARTVARALYRRLPERTPAAPLFDTSLAFVVADQAAELVRLFDVLSAIEVRDVDYVFVDNASMDQSAAMLAQLSGDVQVIRPPTRLPTRDALELAAGRARGRTIHAAVLGERPFEELAEVVSLALLPAASQRAASA